jgi:hypothetical protein
VQDTRLPPDLRIICADPRWCLNRTDADIVANDMKTFMARLRADEPLPRMPCDPSAPPPKKRGHRPVPSQAASYNKDNRRTADAQEVRSRNVHVPSRTRPKMIEHKSSRNTPTVLLMDIVRILIEAAKVGVGDFVNLCYDCTRHKTHYDHGMHLFAMSLKQAREWGNSNYELELFMCKQMETHRPSPSIISWIESLITNHHSVDSGESGFCRLFPTIGHIVNFEDPTAVSQLAMQRYPHMSEMRYEKWSETWVGGSPRAYTWKHFLWNHNQSHNATEFKAIDFKELPEYTPVNRVDHDWLTYLDVNHYTIHLPLNADDHGPDGMKNVKEIYLDGFADVNLYNFNPWPRGEASTLHGRLTDRMKRNQRKSVQLFLKRTFTSCKDEAGSVASHCLCCFSRVGSVWHNNAV